MAKKDRKSGEKTAFPTAGLRKYVVSFSTSPSQSLSDRKPAEGLVPLTEIGVVRVSLRNLAIFWQDFIHVLRPGDLHTLAQRKSPPPHTRRVTLQKGLKKRGPCPPCGGGGDSQQIRRMHHTHHTLRVIGCKCVRVKTPRVGPDSLLAFDTQRLREAGRKRDYGNTGFPYRWTKKRG
jgi:hypothetical protein